jgi:inner membrane protein
MDSLTQIVLGASVGEAVCGKRAGNKALLWGAVAGTIPDLDVLASPFQDLVQQLTFHRSVTHSLLFAVVTSPLFAYLLKWIYRNDETRFRDWFWLFFLGFTTHALLDCCTTWGTRVFYPFSDYAVSFHNIFVIDPLYTIPFLFCVILCSFYNKKDRRRSYWNYAGLVISTFYMLLTLTAKFYVNGVFEKNFAKDNITWKRYSTKPTPFNAILWSATAETDSGYYIGYYSLLDEHNKEVKFRYFQKNHQSVNHLRNNEKVLKLLNVTEGYYTVEKKSDSILINDLRFGQLDGWGKGKEPFTFTYIITEEKNGDLKFSQLPNNLKKARSLMGALFRRVMGNKE